MDFSPQKKYGKIKSVGWVGKGGREGGSRSVCSTTQVIQSNLDNRGWGGEPDGTFGASRRILVTLVQIVSDKEKKNPVGIP